MNVDSLMECCDLTIICYNLLPMSEQMWMVTKTPVWLLSESHTWICTFESFYTRCAEHWVKKLYIYIKEKDADGVDCQISNGVYHRSESESLWLSTFRKRSKSKWSQSDLGWPMLKKVLVKVLNYLQSMKVEHPRDIRLRTIHASAVSKARMECAAFQKQRQDKLCRMKPMWSSWNRNINISRGRQNHTG